MTSKNIPVPQVWYHGGPNVSFYLGEGIRWDRERGTSDLNVEGPGIYLSTSPGNAAAYGPYLHRIYLCKERPNLLTLTSPKPTLATLVELAKYAPEDSKYNFVTNWNHEDVTPRTLRESLAKYVPSGSLHGAFQSLYGDLFMYDADAFVEAMLAMGIDGVLVDRRLEHRPDQWHLVVYNRRIVCDPELVTLAEDGDSVE